MSEENKEKGKKRWVGKVRNLNHNNGPYQQIYMDNLNSQNADGTENKYYKGALVWFDQETGKRYLVKQLGFATPQKGMDGKLIEKGFSCYITINLDDEYAVDELP